ncbi:hypothetical protein I5M32_11275 [Pedobacter sp. SD-b]|uniref:AAA domain-containing protein n=1 Tax=Pedobacter segetis TaxID=2793069 RepID=A0ABS1BKW6_9SPHI|nr:hypothetical protein [Pedobacter segetis]MBK0383538.1 hypothetical protein [Pedobacter segetis]
MARDLHHTTLMVAKKGTGKSTKLAEIAKCYARYSKVLVIDVNGSPAYNFIQEIELKRLRLVKGNGIVKLIGVPDEETLEHISKHFTDGLIIFEDCTKYILGNLSKGIKKFLTDHRMLRLDLIFTFHSLKRIPPQMWEMASYVSVGKTVEVFEQGANRNRIPNYENILKAWKKVCAHPSPYHSLTVETFV